MVFRTPLSSLTKKTKTKKQSLSELDPLLQNFLDSLDRAFPAGIAIDWEKIILIKALIKTIVLQAHQIGQHGRLKEDLAHM